MVEGLPRAA